VLALQIVCRFPYCAERKKPTVATAARIADDRADLEIELKDPIVAGVLAFLWPGAGHWYQGRRSKAVLLMVCILGLFFYGFYLGKGRIVYFGGVEDAEGGGGIRGRLASIIIRLPYYCQFPVGIPALPALFRMNAVQDMNKDVFDRSNWYAPPRDRRELHAIHKELNRFFELARLFTSVAGLLNVLAIYDAIKGPAYARLKEEAAGQPA
jgi:hypothetical protein